MSKKNDNPDSPLREDIRQLRERRTFLDDEKRKEKVDKRHAKGQRTARENIADLCDPDSFIEYGSLIIAGQKSRKSEKELIEQTPADGLIAGTATVNGTLFGAEQGKCFVMSYDYMVLAGTQGAFNHKKTDRLLGLVKLTRKPLIFFVEGGGGRPGDVDFDLISNGGLDIMTFSEYARLSGKVPRIAIVSGYCFAGNAAIAGCSDIIIATKDSSLGMGGPAMIEGGGLGHFHPKEIGPATVQFNNGVIDILVDDEAQAVSVAKKYLSYFQGRLDSWNCPDQEILQTVVPANRKFGYDVFKVINGLCDTDSVLELRGGYARNLITALVRIEGRPMGLMANSTRHLGGAIDSAAADKAARFMQLCDAFGIPILSLCDAPGFMVGPDCEATAMVRRSSRMFVVGASLNVPILTIVLRKAYGLGAMAMSGGSLHESLFTIAWPTGEFGAMGLEGAVELGYKRELEAIEDPQKKQKKYDDLVKAAYEKGKALKAAQTLEFDEVIEPRETRRWIVSALDTCFGSKDMANNRMIDCW